MVSESEVKKYINKEIILHRGKVKVIAKVEKVENLLIHCSNFNFPLNLEDYDYITLPKNLPI